MKITDIFVNKLKIETKVVYYPEKSLQHKRVNLCQNYLNLFIVATFRFE